MVEGLAPPTRAVAHSQVTICRRLRIQYVFLHMCGVNQFWIIVFFAAVKPANNILFCIELIQRPESSLRRHKLGSTDQSIRSNDDKTYSVTVVTSVPWDTERVLRLDKDAYGKKPFFSWTEVYFNHAVKLHDYWFVQW